MRINVLMQRFFADFFKIIEKLLIALSHWLVLVSFYEADWWHFTDPNSIGISTKAIIILLMSLFVPTGLFFCKHLITFKLSFIKQTICKVTPAFLLLSSSLPFFAQLPWVRTGILALGVALSPLCLTVNLSQHSDEHKQNKCCGTQNCFKPTIALKKSNSLTSEAVHLRIDAACHESGLFENHSEAIILVAVLINMTIRWCFGTINIFYEAWQASLALFMCLISFAILSCFQTRKGLGYSKARKSIGSVSAHTDIVLTTDQENKVWRCKSNNNPEKSNQHDSSSKEQESLAERVLSDDEASSSPESNERTTFVESFSVTTNSSKRVRISLLYIAGATLGLSIGTLLVMYLWVFSSPNLLPRWSGEDPKSHGYLVLLFFGLGTLFSLCHKAILNLAAQRPRLALSRNSKCLKISIWDVTSIFLLAVYIILLVSATILLMQDSFYHQSFVGSLMFCSILPCCLSLNILAIQHLLGFIVKIGRRHMMASFFFGIISFCIGTGFLISHVVLVLFVNPQITTIFLGRMDIILTYQVLVIIASLVASTIAFRVSQLHRGDSKKDYEIDSLNLSTSSGVSQTKNWIGVSKALALVLLILLFLVIGLWPSSLHISQHCLQLHSSSYNRVLKSYGNLSNPNTEKFSVLSWNILLGHDKYGKDNLPCVGGVLKVLRPDVIGLEESEALPPYWGSKDILAYLSGYLGNAIKTYSGVHPLQSSLGVAILTNHKVTKHQRYLLPADETTKLPHYSLVRTDVDINNRSITVFNLHAVFKNWTATARNVCPFANVSEKQMNFIAQKVMTLNPSQPVIVMGDFNLNPNEPQLDILHKLGFQNALHHNRDLNPPSTIRNRFAIIDHVFYRGLNMTESKIIVETEDMSDHNPVMAFFDLPT